MLVFCISECYIRLLPSAYKTYDKKGIFTASRTHAHTSERKRSALHHFIGKFITGGVAFGNFQIVVPCLVAYLNSRNTTIEQVGNASIFERVKLIFAIKLV